jgi:uncharacterized protein (AIM24 family)
MAGTVGYIGSLKTIIDNLIDGAKDRANHTGTQSVSTITGLAAVAKSGVYSDLTGKPTIPTNAAGISDFTEAAQDAAAAMFRAGANVTFTYDDAANTFTINASGGGASTTDQEVVRDTIGGALAGGANIQITVNDAADSITIAVTGLAAVATSGAYSDLTGKPALAAVATSGAYADLSGKPAIPTTAAGISDFSEAAQDAAAAMFRAGTNVTFTYDDAANTFTINASGGGASSTDPEVVRDTIGGALVGGANIQITVNDAADTITIAVTGLAAVATSGAYSDLTGKPTIPAAYTDEQAQDAIAALFGAGTQSGVTFAYDDAGNRISASVTGGGGSSGANDTLLINAAAHSIVPANADNSAALNSLITTVNAAGGGVIVFPPGVYGFGSTINLKQGVFLASATGNHGYIAASPSAQTVKFNQNSSFTGTWLIDTPNGGWSLGIQGIDLSGNGTATGGLRFQGVYWGAVKQSMANGFGLSGFRQEQGSQGNAGFACVYEDLMTTNCASSATAVTGAGDFDGTDHYFARCEFAARGAGTGIASSNKWVVAFVLRGSNHFVSDSVFETSDRGAVIYATKSRITACRADTNGGDGWWVVGGANTFTGCDAIGNSQAATNTHDDFIVDNAAWGSYFVNCHSRLAGSIKPRYGWNIQTTIQEPVYAGGYALCSAEDAGTARWNFPNGQTAGVLFAPFPVKPAAGTVTPDVHETSGVVDLSLYTSATTITNFTGGVDGQSIRLLGNANVTVANNATIVTSTGAAKALTAGVIFTFTRHGGVWRENASPAASGGGTSSTVVAAAFYHTGSQTVPTGSVTQITIGATDFNDSTSYFTLANNVVTLVKAGLYNVVWNGDASGGGTAGTRSFFVRLNGNGIAEASSYTDGSEVRISGTKTFRASAGQTLDLAAYFSTGAGVGATFAKDTGLTVTYLGA